MRNRKVGDANQGSFLSPAVRAALEKKAKLTWRFEGREGVYFLDGENIGELTSRANDKAALALHGKLLSVKANIDPNSLNLAISSYAWR